jgi:hypothetical protein
MKKDFKIKLFKPDVAASCSDHHFFFIDLTVAD